MNIKKYLDLHNKQTTNNVALVPEPWFARHTMQDALDTYVRQKLPAVEINRALSRGETVEAHGTYPTFGQEVFAHLGFENLKAITNAYNPSQKRFNYVRPAFYHGTKDDEGKILAAVAPGEFYLTNFTEMLRFYAIQRGHDPDLVIATKRYPDIEKAVTEWTDLDERFVKPGDRVVTGYVQEVEDRIVEQGGLRFQEEQENDFYVSRRYEVPNKPDVNFLGVKFTFWGDISARIAEKCCELGAEEILYVSKIGSITSPDDLYTRLFVPSRFFVVRHMELLHTTLKLKNSLLDTSPALDSGGHVTTPTVMEQSFDQRQFVAALGARSIDIENALMTEAIEGHNERTGAEVKFSCIHFATDYLYDQAEPFSHGNFNLSNNRSELAKQGKENMLDAISIEVGKHLRGDPDKEALNAKRPPSAHGTPLDRNEP